MVAKRSTTQRRPAAYRDTDISALRAIAQAAVNVELFTIPLYMGTMYSIWGMHQVTGKENDFYENRLWPGAATTADPETPNERAFNLIFSVFIEEMLHLQIAANIASAIGVTPIFTSPALQDDRHGWTCYGPHKTVIPHIVDLRDTTHNVPVNIAALTVEQVALFQAIEEPAAMARSNVIESAHGRYFPTVPFPNWTPDKTEKDLPMFGTIDAMYQCFFDYMSLQYDDGDNTLFAHVFKSGSIQNDMFNFEESPGHPKREYSGFDTTVTATDPAEALAQVLDMMDAITDQGEGSVLDQLLEDGEDVTAVEARYLASPAAVAVDYPYYTDDGELTASADAEARSGTGNVDHYERFTELRALVADVVTWPMWHQRHGPWTANDLQTAPPPNTYGIPSTAEVADAMNRMTASRDTMHELISQAAVGTIAGITTVLDKYWAQSDVGFPTPAMNGSGDRIAICWALFGEPPDLSLGVGDPDTSKIYHACQGLDLAIPGHYCAAVEIYHNCRGSNMCAFQGGCGFVQKISEGGTPGASCGFALVHAKTTGHALDTFSAPSDNRCASFGGCAVPMAAAQLFAQSGTMELFDDDSSEPFDTMKFAEGEKVDTVAWRAYQKVMAHRGGETPDAPPPPNDLRLVLVPSK